MVKGRGWKREVGMVKGRAYLGTHRHSFGVLDPCRCLQCVPVMSSLGHVASSSSHVVWSCHHSASASCHHWAMLPAHHHHLLVIIACLVVSSLWLILLVGVIVSTGNGNLFGQNPHAHLDLLEIFFLLRKFFCFSPQVCLAQFL